MIKSIKVMLLPNNKQFSKLLLTANIARYAYNWTLDLQLKQFKQNQKYLSDSEVRKLFTQYKQKNQWLYKVSNNATKQAIKDCCNAFWDFINEKKKASYTPYSKEKIAHSARIGKNLIRYDMRYHPKFKKKGKSELKFYVDTEKIKFSGTHVKLENISDSKRKNRAKVNWVKLAENNRIPTDVKYMNPRVKFDGINWWISISIEVEEPIKHADNTGVLGIDVGIKDLAILSDEKRTIFKNINKTKTVKRLKKKQHRLQRKISRKYFKNKKGESYCKTKNIIKSEKSLLKINRRLTGIRHNHIHQSTSEIMKQKPSRIVLEDLNVSGMMKNKHLAKAIQEQSLYEFSQQIEYKSSWNGIELIKVDRFYPSSKLCSVCGNIKSDLKLSDRIYRCDCGNVIDRDYQAALNLKKYGELLA